jgi:hypothetical protein
MFPVSIAMAVITMMVTVMISVIGVTTMIVIGDFARRTPAA